MKKNYRTTILATTLKSVKIFKSIKVFKIALSVASMALFAFCETAMMGLALALCIVTLLFIHEMGHALAIRSRGLGIKLPVFIPFVGAAIFCPKFEDRETEAFVGLGGPLLGTLAAVLFAIPYLFTANQIWLTGSFIGLSLNFFNMLPISPFDGGRITQAADSRLRFIGYAALLVFTVVAGEPGMLFLWIVIISDRDWTATKKFTLSLPIALIMTVLTIIGVGKNPIGNWADCSLGSALVVIMFSVMHSEKGKKQDDEHGDIRPMPDCQTRIAWFVIWSLLAVIQLWVIFTEAGIAKIK